MEEEGSRIESRPDRKGRLPRKQITDKTEFRKIAKLLAKRVVSRRMLYSEAETALMKLRAGSHYQRLEKAEDEAARALSRWFSKQEFGQSGKHAGRPSGQPAHLRSRLPEHEQAG